VYPSLEQSTNTSPGLTLAFFGRSAFPKPGLAQHYGHITFMGTSVLRQDNAYSFQVIVKTLKSVIPTLIEASMETAVEPVVTTVIHVFADALPEVPEHRRIPVFDKLLTTLDPEIYLWLAPTLILSNMATQGPRLGRGLVKDDDKDRVAPDVEFSLNVCHLYKPQVQLNACIRMIEYLQSLPLEKDERRRLTRNENKDMTEGSAPFSLDVHSTRQLCHFKLLLVNFISTLLSSNRLVAQLVELDETEKPSLEKIYQKLVETALEYTQSVSRQVDLPLKVTSAEQGPNPKFWRALLHRSYDVIDRSFFYLNFVLSFF
jgi:U3 small nucleolar RNA-associated protein 10